MSTPERKLHIITIRLYAEDLDYLKLAYPQGGYNRIIRALVSRHIRALRNRTVELVESRLSDEEISSV